MNIKNKWKYKDGNSGLKVFVSKELVVPIMDDDEDDERKITCEPNSQPPKYENVLHINLPKKLDKRSFDFHFDENGNFLVAKYTLDNALFKCVDMDSAIPKKRRPSGLFYKFLCAIPTRLRRTKKGRFASNQQPTKKGKKTK